MVPPLLFFSFGILDMKSDYFVPPVKFPKLFRFESSPKNGMLNARCERLNSVGIKSTLTQKDFTRATNGFISKIKFHVDIKTFSCPNCGTSPKYLVADGKEDGPSKRKVSHLKEFGRADGDNSFLPQGITPDNRN